MIRASESLQVLNSSGQVVVREAMRMVFFIRRPHREIASMARRAIESFVDLVSIGSFEYGFDMEGNPEELTLDTYTQSMDDWFSGPYSTWPNASIHFVGRGGVAPEVSLTYLGKALGDPGFPGDAGVLDVWLTTNFFDENAARVKDYFRTTSGDLSSCVAYMNLALVGGRHAAKQALAKRYYGIDIAHSGALSADLDSRVPGIYWWNYLSEAVVTQLGGANSIGESLGEGCTIEMLSGGGALVQLGSEPLLGDRNRREVLPAHQAFARFVDAKGLLHVPRKVTYFKDAQSLGDMEAQHEWHLRFLQHN